MLSASEGTTINCLMITLNSSSILTPPQNSWEQVVAWTLSQGMTETTHHSTIITSKMRRRGLGSSARKGRAVFCRGSTEEFRDNLTPKLCIEISMGTARPKWGSGSTCLWGHPPIIGSKTAFKKSPHRRSHSQQRGRVLYPLPSLNRIIQALGI